MPVVSRQRARKDYKCRHGCEIPKGAEYYRAKKKFQRPRFGCLQHPFKGSELATSDKVARLLGVQEMLQTHEVTATSLEDILSDLQSGAETAREVGEEYEESASNMEEYFSGSSQVDEIRDKAGNCEDWASQLEDAQGEIESLQSEVEDLMKEKQELEEQIDKAEETPEEPPERLQEIEDEIQEKLDEVQSKVDDVINELMM